MNIEKLNSNIHYSMLIYKLITISVPNQLQFRAQFLVF